MNRIIPSQITVAEGCRIVQLVCGSEHTLVLISKNDAGVENRDLGDNKYLQICSDATSSLKSKASEAPLLCNHTVPSNLPYSPISDSSLKVSSPDPLLQSNNVKNCVVEQSPELPCNNENNAIDSGTVSSASESGSTSHLNKSSQNKENASATLSNSSDPLVQEDKVNLDVNKVVVPPSKSFLLKQLQERDEPVTLSPIDSPRTFTTSSLHNRLLSDPPKQEKLEKNSEEPVVFVEKRSGGKDFPAIYSWGWNEHGNCGVGSTENIFTPQRIKAEGRVVLVGAGSGHSFALIRNYSKISL